MNSCTDQIFHPIRKNDIRFGFSTTNDRIQDIVRYTFLSSFEISSPRIIDPTKNDQWRPDKRFFFLNECWIEPKRPMTTEGVCEMLIYDVTPYFISPD